MEPIKRNNNFSNPELAITVGNIVSAMRRDAVQMLTRGVTTANIDAFEAEGDAFEVFPTDEIYQAEVTIVVDQKNIARSNCTTKIQLISGFFEQKWGLESPYYKQLGIKGITKSKEAEFIVVSRRVVAVATTRLSELSTSGLTQADIDYLEAEAQVMEDKVHLIFEKTAEREIKTQERTELANSLYNNLKKYCTIGKLIWENVDEAKYNDYIIHKTTTTGLPKPQNLVVELDPIAPTQANLTWSPVVGASEYELYSSQVPLGAPSAEFSLVNTVSSPSDEQILISGFRFYYKVRAINPSQESDFSDEVWIES